MTELTHAEEQAIREWLPGRGHYHPNADAAYECQSGIDYCWPETMRRMLATVDRLRRQNHDAAAARDKKERLRERGFARHLSAHKMVAEMREKAPNSYANALLLEEAYLKGRESLEPIVRRAAAMGLCSQTHHEHLLVDAQRALEGDPPPGELGVDLGKE